jgi:hypothetical protein
VDRNQLRLVPGVRIWQAAGEVAAVTPEDRDRAVDLVRSFSLAVVVLGHILMAVVVWDAAKPRILNVLDEYPALRIATWALQVMPLFFAAGAIANRASYARAGERGEPWRVWFWGRLRRLVRPVVYYLAAWVAIVFALEVVVPDAAATLARLSTQLLWFLGVYVLVVATTPVQRRLAAHGLRSVLALLTVVVVVDLLRFHVAEVFDVTNFVLVWIMAATLGLVVHDWRDDRRVQLGLLAVGALVVNAVLIRWLPYPLSMVGLPSDRLSNMAPPTLVLAMHSVVMITVVGAAWPALRRWCRRPLVWHTTCAVGGVAMSAYLWHLTALILVAVVEHALGLDRTAPHAAGFWISTLLHTTVLLFVVVALVSLVAPLEYLPVPWLERAEPPAPPADWRTAAAVIGVLVTGIGFLVLAGTGMGGFPFGRVTRYAGLELTPGLGIALLALGVLAARAGGRPATTLRNRAV